MSKDIYNVSLPELKPFDVTCDIKVLKLPMRDGVKLHTIVFFPPEMPEKAPVLLIRTPYSRTEWLSLPSENALKHGVVHIMQACRGTGFSEGGVFHPSDRDVEKNDAEDLFAWLNTQPWFNGRCVMSAASYCGWVQWCAMRGKNNPLVGISPRVAPLYSCCGSVRPGGCSSLLFAQNWPISMYHRRTYGYDSVPDYVKMQLFRHLPAAEADIFAGYSKPLPVYRDFIASAAEPSLSLDDWDEGFEKFRAPAFISGGWFDGFKQETIASFQLIKQRGATAGARNFSRLTIGPWGHPGLLNPELFGAENDYRDLLPREEKFLFGLLNDPTADPLPGEMQVRYFMLGENKWYDSGDWPPPGTAAQTMYLHSSGNANTSAGDGLINNVPPEAEMPDNFTSNPNDPVTTQRGDDPEPSGCYDRSYMETRADMLVYTSKKLTAPLKITGNIRLRFFASATTPDTDIFATLTDVTPDGRSMLLTTGGIRARFAGSWKKPELLTPGKIYQFEIDLGDTAVMFQSGHALRLELCGQEFPAFDRNANTGNKPMHDTVLRTGNITVYHDAEHPAELILPVLK